jgi:hypothetical protein
MFVSRFLSSPRSSIQRSVQRYLSSSAPAVAPFQYQELFDLSQDNTPYRKVTDKHVKVIEVGSAEIANIILGNIFVGRWDEILKS